MNRAHGVAGKDVEMNKRDAKRWACGMAAAILAADIDVGILGEESDPDYHKRVAAWKELVEELRRRGYFHE